MAPFIRVFLLAALAPALAIAQPAGRSDPGQDAPAEAGIRAAPSAPVASLLAEADASYARRDDPAQLAAHRARLAEAEKLAPGDYDVLWRLARLNFWLADDPKLPGKEKSRLGKTGWDYGDRATVANPKGVEGWYFELPWPKYDARKSKRSLEQALAKNPNNVRVHVYLAELNLKEERFDGWRTELQKALAAPPGRYDAPEERRWQEVARRMLADPPVEANR